MDLNARVTQHSFTDRLAQHSITDRHSNTQRISVFLHPFELREVILVALLGCTLASLAAAVHLKHILYSVSVFNSQAQYPQ